MQSQQIGYLANEAGVAMAYTSRGHNAGDILRSFAEVITTSITTCLVNML